VNLTRNVVVTRALEIARQDLAPFDTPGLKRLFKAPWEQVRELPELTRQTGKRSHGHLTSVCAVRLTFAEHCALKKLTEKNRTTVSPYLREVIEGILARSKEAA
jgi:hypothetical protein